MVSSGPVTNGQDIPKPEGGGAGQAPTWLECLDHTADTGITVEAETLQELFARAAWGMFSIITDPEKVVCRSSESIGVEATDLEALLVRWLSELNYRHVTRHLVYGRFEVLELEPHRLVARVCGETIDPTRHTVYTEIKAVTFHGLAIRPVNTGWRAEIIFDL